MSASQHAMENDAEPHLLQNRWSWIGTAVAVAKSLQSCVTLCDPIDGSPPGFSVPGILQARMLEWVAIAFSHVKLGRKSFADSLASEVSFSSNQSIPGAVLACPL